MKIAQFLGRTLSLFLAMMALLLVLSPYGCWSDKGDAYGDGKDTSSWQSFYQDDCVFCRIVAGKEPAQVIYQDDMVMVIEKKPVRHPVNCLIIPKKHIENLKELNETDEYRVGPIVAHMALIASMDLSPRLNGSGDFKILINNGTGAGQTVPHLHMHFMSKEEWR